MFPREFEKFVRAELGADRAEGLGTAGDARVDEAEALLAALDDEPVVSVRYNPFKISAMPREYAPAVYETRFLSKACICNRRGEREQRPFMDYAEPQGGKPKVKACDGAEQGVYSGVNDELGAECNAAGVRFSLKPVPWNRYGAYLAERPVFTLDPAMHAGAYYVQEASSQFVEHILREALGEECNATGTRFSRELPEGIRLLDLCAAPGGKTTLYSTLVGPAGLVVANEVIKQRAGILADNVRRWGIGNVAVSCNEPAAFAAFKHWFDVLAVDAPCSGEGMFRKNREARAEWSPANVELCAARQRRILADAWDALRPGGVLIYSTCTFNRRENEENVAWLAENFAVEPVVIDVPAEWGIERGEVGSNLSSEWRSGEARQNFETEHTGAYVMARNSKRNEASPPLSRQIQTFRFWPHKARGEGFFAAVMRKADGRTKRETPRSKREPLVELNRPDSRPLAGWVETPDAMKFARAGENCYGYYRPVYRDVAVLAGGLNIIYSGVCMGRLFGGKLRPDHALALFHEVARRNDGMSMAEVTREEALDYLRKREFSDPERLAEGINLLLHDGLPIGWTKRIGHRTNTMLPDSFRIVNL